MSIRIDCYLSVLKTFKKTYPDALFEVITRAKNHPLSPSWDLLKRARRENWEFKKYEFSFLTEIAKSSIAKKRLRELQELHKHGVDIFLVCYEKDPLKCHRSIIKNLLEKQEYIE